MTVDWQQVRKDFPALHLTRDNQPLVFLDSSASAHKPQIVIDRMSLFMQQSYANVHRGLYHLSEIATRDYENARQTLAKFIGATSPDHIVFTSNATAAINLVAHGFAVHNFGPTDSVLFSALEHHANIVPWQMAAKRAGFSNHVIPLLASGDIDLNALENLLKKHHTKLVALAHASNVLGGVIDLRFCADLTHRYGALLLIDGSQGIVHQPVDVVATDIDFYIATGHKLYGPSGIGFLYSKPEHLRATQPIMGGGDMILTVSYDHSVFTDPPVLFEAGTPPIIEAIGLAAAIDYIKSIDMHVISAREHILTQYMLESLQQIPEVTIWGKSKNRIGIVSFSIANIHPQDIGQMIDHLSGVAVRAGHHCAMPLHDYLNIPYNSSVRASLGLYNNKEDIDKLCIGLRKVIAMF